VDFGLLFSPGRPFSLMAMPAGSATGGDDGVLVDDGELTETEALVEVLTGAAVVDMTDEELDTHVAASSQSVVETCVQAASMPSQSSSIPPEQTRSASSQS
jgi:hypothetical protein